METTKGFLLTRESNSILLKIIDQKKKNQPPHDSQRVRVGRDPELSINLFFYVQEGSQIATSLMNPFSNQNKTSGL